MKGSIEKEQPPRLEIRRIVPQPIVVSEEKDIFSNSHSNSTKNHNTKRIKKVLNKDIEELTYSYPNRQSMPMLQDHQLKTPRIPIRKSDDKNSALIHPEKKMLRLEYKIPRANRVKKNAPLPRN